MRKTCSRKRNTCPSSPAPSTAANNYTRISIGTSWGDNTTLPISSEIEQRHAEMRWMSCTDNGCEIHKNEKEIAGCWPKDHKVGKQSKKMKRKEQDTTPTLNTALKEGQASLLDIPYLSESLPPFRMTHNILPTPPMAFPAFGLLYSRSRYDSEAPTNPNQNLSTLHTRLIGILAE